jgi:hypothetical protein
LVTSDQLLTVFVDANVLAKPLTRSLVMLAAEASGYVVVWSAYAEAEADRHVTGSAKPVSVVRQTRTSQELSPTGDRAERFTSTKASDRQILADAVAAGALLLVTEDVDDFGHVDLAATGIAAVHYDLFLAERATTAGYLETLHRLSAAMTNPKRTIEQLHARLGRLHPLTVAAHGHAVDATPDAPTHNPPAELFRGDRCLRCLNTGTTLVAGVCATCRAQEGSR